MLAFARIWNATMLRKLLILGVFAGSSASVPILYQANPDAFERLLKSAVAQNTAPAPDEGSAKDGGAVKVVKAPTMSDVPLGRKVRLSADSRGHFTGDFKLNGRKVGAMVDTGATLVALNLSTARRIGIQLGPDDFKYKVDTANGQTRAASAVIASLQIGRITVENVQAVVLDDSALNSTLVGVSFLSRLAKYQVEDGTLLLVQ